MAEREGEVTRVLKSVAQTIHLGKYGEALRVLLHLSEKYPEAGEIRPQIAEVFLRRGESRARKGRFKEARVDLERSLDWARNPGAYVALARTLIGDGRLERAHEVLASVLEIDGRYGPAHEAMGMLMLRWEEPAEAARMFEQALGLGAATPAAYLGAWEAHLRAERPDRAHELILEGALRFPKSDALQAAAGDSCLYALGDGAAAVPHWRRAVEINPDNLGVLFKLAAEAASRDDRAESLARLRRCAELDPERTRQLWREDLSSLFPRFGSAAGDPEFLRVLGG